MRHAALHGALNVPAAMLMLLVQKLENPSPSATMTVHELQLNAAMTESRIASKSGC